jgi:hypothetical protein
MRHFRESNGLAMSSEMNDYRTKEKMPLIYKTLNLAKKISK